MFEAKAVAPAARGTFPATLPHARKPAGLEADDAQILKPLHRNEESDDEWEYMPREFAHRAHVQASGCNTGNYQHSAAAKANT